MTEHLFKSWHYRLEIYVFGQEAQADEILTQLAETAIYQVHNRLNQAGARFAAHLAHHAEVEVGEPAICHSQQVAGVGVGVEKAVLQ